MLHKIYRTILFGLSVILISLALSNISSISQLNTTSSIQSNWIWPLDGDFMVITEAKYATIVNNTNYGVRNLDLIHSRTGHMSCFNVGWHRNYHAGVDLMPRK